MRNLYERTGKEPDPGWELNDVEKDIMKNWVPGYNLFSIGQMTSRHSISKRACRRALKRFLLHDIVRMCTKIRERMKDD